MGLSNTPDDWSDYFRHCEEHNQNYHASEGCCEFCAQKVDVLKSAGPCPGCEESNFEVKGKKGKWYLECQTCDHESAKVFYMEDLEGEEWPTEDNLTQ